MESGNVRKLDFEPSIPLSREVEAMGTSLSRDEDAFAQYATPESVAHYIESSPVYADFVKHVEQGKRRKILDVGSGFGFTSVYMAIKGHQVSCVEPSEHLCQNTLRMATNTGAIVNFVNIYNGTGESMDQVNEDFEEIVFHSSLHHCDDPRRALRNAYGLLRSNGTIVLLCEPILHAFRSKESFHRALEENPDSLDHYGGNEHTYRHREYVLMLRDAGFRDARSELSHSLFLKPRFAKKTGSGKKIAVSLFYSLVGFLSRIKAIQTIKPLLDSLSLGPRIFHGVKS